METYSGDVTGFIERIDHIADLGASCIWLMPLYPTPNQDDGYDITDYLGVDTRLGDLGDIVEAIRHANDRGLRVLADLVVNHTSIEHPWFAAARADRTSRYRDYYVWTDDPEREAGTTAGELDVGRAGGAVLPAPLRAVPARPEHHQPGRPGRDRQDRRLLAQAGGVRLSHGRGAVPVRGGRGQFRGHRRREALAARAARVRGPAPRRRDAHGEVNVDADQIASYFEDHGDALHLQLGFLINQRLWLSLARGEAGPLEDLIRHLPVPPHDSGWATFLRNHDELTLDKLSEDERDEVFAVFAPDEDMRIYGHGIRRRAASMLGDGARLRMAWSLTLSLPGTPVILYGDEIGMVEDLAIAGRMAVRTPMAVGRRRRPASRCGLAAAVHDAARASTPRHARARLGRAAG